MKKPCLFITFLISVFCLFVFTGCSITNSVKSISLVGGEEVIVIDPGKFNYDDYKILVSYSNGNTEELALNEEMISAYEKLKFYQIGEQVVNISYRNRSCEMKIKVQRTNLDDLVLESKTVTYTGKPYTMQVQGNIPADVTVRYPNGNTFSNAGTYDITAICYGDNYETKEFSATLTIEKAKYDMSNVKFEDATFDFDKTPKSISLNGTLPDGVRVEYKIGERTANSETNAGKYTVIAKFTSNDVNYEQIPEMSATLTINKAKYADFDLKFTDKDFVYTGHSNSIDADLTAVPNGVSAYYTIQKIKNAKGENVESAIENGNSATLAGTYIVSVNFKISDTENYENIEPKTAVLFIDRAVYTFDNAFMYSNSVVYDGTEKSISLSGEEIGSQPELPFGVNITYTSKMVADKNGNEIEGSIKDGNSAINAGTYEITAHLISDDENYKEISDIIGILEIRPVEYENLMLSMTDLTVSYDGNEHSISVSYSKLPETVTIKYTMRKIKNSDGSDIQDPISVDGNSATEVGTYEITATFVNSDENYSDISSLTAVLTISEVE